MLILKIFKITIALQIQVKIQQEKIKTSPRIKKSLIHTRYRVTNNHNKTIKKFYRNLIMLK